MVMYIDVSDVGVGHYPFPYLIDYHLEAALSQFFISTKELFKACLLPSCLIFRSGKNVSIANFSKD